MNYYIEVLKKYAVFSGRARRKEYWMFYLYDFLIFFALVIAEGMIGTRSGTRGLLSNIYNLAVLIPSIAVSVRRMHDVNKSGWYLIFPIYNFILSVTGGTKGANKYGPDPKEINVV